MRTATARVAIVSFLASCLLAFPCEAKDPGLADNLFLEAGGGIESSAHDGTGGLGLVGLNWGLPLTDTEGVALGFQLGGDLKLSEESPEWNATAGPFLRNLPSLGGQEAAAALLFDWVRTPLDGSLFALRPILGTTAGSRDALGLSATIGLNDDRTGRGVREELVDRVEAFWNRTLSDRLTAEISAGYQLGDVDAALFGPQLVFGVTPHLDLGAATLVNTDGDYGVLFRTSWNFGGTGRHASIHNVAGEGSGLFTPFPKRQYAELLRDVDRPRAGLGGDAPGLTPEPSPSPNPSPSPEPSPSPGPSPSPSPSPSPDPSPSPSPSPSPEPSPSPSPSPSPDPSPSPSPSPSPDPSPSPSPDGCNRGKGNGPDDCSPGNSGGKGKGKEDDSNDDVCHPGDKRPECTPQDD